MNDPVFGVCPECGKHKELHETCKRGNCVDCGCPWTHEPRCIDWDEIDRNRAAREARRRELREGLSE